MSVSLLLAGRFFALLLLSLPALAQTQQEKIQQLAMEREAAFQRQVRLQFDSAMLLTESGAYAAADKKYRYVLNNIKAVPSDLAYFFGRNSFHLAQYKQSIDWLSKYIQLKGTNGRYFDDATRWLKQAEEKRLGERKADVQQAREVLSHDYDIDCGSTGKVTCPVCNGSTVIVRKTYLGDSYKTCPHCHQQGYLTCEEYNRLIRGRTRVEQ
jgi:tetratricopeptide (TPR) repeat protein